MEQARPDSPAPLIEINFNDTLTQGLEISAGGSTVKGLAISGVHSGSLLVLDTAGSDTIVGNYIGTNAAGTAASLGRPPMGVLRAFSLPAPPVLTTRSADRTQPTAISSAAMGPTALPLMAHRGT